MKIISLLFLVFSSILGYSDKNIALQVYFKMNPPTLAICEEEWYYDNEYNEMVINPACHSNFTEERYWDKLFIFSGGIPWNTLTPLQKSLIDYPTIDENKVYFVENGSSYHSTFNCYTLSKSKIIYYTSLKNAKNLMDLSPCSKCIK